MLKKIFIFFPILFVPFISAYPDDNVLNITGNESRYPKIYLDINKQAKGPLIDAMNLVAKEMNIHVHYELFPWTRACDEALKGNFGIIGISKTLERLKDYDFSEEPLFYDKLLLITTTSKKLKYDSYEDLKNLKIGVIRGGFYGLEYEKLVKQNYFIRIENYNSESQLEMLLSKKIDAAIYSSGEYSSGEVALESVIQSSNNENLIKNKHKFRILKKPFSYDPNYIAFSKHLNRKDFLSKIDIVIRKLRNFGKLNSIEK